MVAVFCFAVEHLPLIFALNRYKEHVIKKSGRAARLESRLWGSYVDNEAVENGIVLWMQTRLLLRKGTQLIILLIKRCYLRVH